MLLSYPLSEAKANGATTADDARHRQGFLGRQGAVGYRSHRACRRMRRPVRRERRRQIDAHEGAFGRVSARHMGRRDPLGRQAAQSRERARYGARGHRHHPPGTHARTRAFGGREHLPRQRNHAAGRSHELCGYVSTCRRTAAQPQHRRHQRGAARHELRRRPPAAHRDREGAQQAREAADSGRAVVVAHGVGNAHPARHRARPEAARRGMRLHLAQARRSGGRVRHHHGDPRRPACGHGAHEHAHHRTHHPDDGGPRDHAALSV